MLYLYAKLLHVIVGGAILGGIIVSLMQKLPQDFKISLISFLILPLAILQLISGLMLTSIANFEIFENLWLEISFYLIIMLIAVNIGMIVLYKKKTNEILLKILQIISLVIILCAFYTMVFQPEL